jgi:plastocyanin
MRTTRWVRAAAVLATGMLLAACGGNGDDSGDSGGDGSAAADGGSQTVQMTIKDFAFDPSTLQGSAGQTLTIEVSNEDSAEHSFTLDDDSVSQDFEGGDTGSVEVTLPDAGTVGWHCEYHPDTMKGTIQVS